MPLRSFALRSVSNKMHNKIHFFSFFFRSAPGHSSFRAELNDPSVKPRERERGARITIFLNGRNK